MRRYLNFRSLSLSAVLACSSLYGQQVDSPSIRTLAVPASQAKSIATALSMEYREIPEIQVAADAKGAQLVVMAPAERQAMIAAKVQQLLASSETGTTSQLQPLSRSLQHISWRDFEKGLRVLAGDQTTVTTSAQG
ncbi:MAG: general secretion pathway protein GspD, partial [Rubripirellula sp.]|nr:general secretion pathway protein GspD [Rubripirellula sp.]